MPKSNDGPGLASVTGLCRARSGYELHNENAAGTMKNAPLEEALQAERSRAGTPELEAHLKANRPFRFSGTACCSNHFVKPRTTS
jgi:hypothetical protein